MEDALKSDNLVEVVDMLWEEQLTWADRIWRKGWREGEVEMQCEGEL